MTRYATKHLIKLTSVIWILILALFIITPGEVVLLLVNGLTPNRKCHVYSSCDPLPRRRHPDSQYPPRHHKSQRMTNMP